MANYTQYNSSVGTAYQNFFLSKVPEGSDYVIFAMEDYYICIYGDHSSDTSFTDSTVIKISRTYGNQGEVTYVEESNTTYSISYEYYSYSNVGIGTYLVSPYVQQNNYLQSNLQTGILFILLLVSIGFNVIRKRWIDTQ